jgi:hypothetical protein
MHLQKELVGTHKRMGYAFCKDDLMAYSLCSVYLLCLYSSVRTTAPSYGAKNIVYPTTMPIQKYLQRYNKNTFTHSNASLCAVSVPEERSSYVYEKT